MQLIVFLFSCKFLNIQKYQQFFKVMLDDVLKYSSHFVMDFQITFRAIHKNNCWVESYLKKIIDFESV